MSTHKKLCELLIRKLYAADENVYTSKNIFVESSDRKDDKFWKNVTAAVGFVHSFLKFRLEWSHDQVWNAIVKNISLKSIQLMI